MSLREHIIASFVVGGAIVASVSYLGTFVDPLLGAIWWSYPLSLLPSIYFMYQSKRDNKFIAKFCISTTYAMILLVATTYALAYFFKNQKEGISKPIIKSTIFWFAISGSFYYLMKKYDLVAKFMK